MSSPPPHRPQYYYSTQPALAWCIRHYFYGQVHFTWAATPFLPYKKAYPESSNPDQMYADLLEPWRDRDPYERFVALIAAESTQKD